MLESSRDRRRRALRIQGGSSEVYDSKCYRLKSKSITQIYSAMSTGRMRVERFEHDYPAFLMSLASSVKTGLSPLSALSACVRVLPQDSLLACEVNRMISSIAEGRGEDHAFRHFAESVPHPDVALLRAALSLSKSQGSSLAPTLVRLARITRLRQSFRRKIRSALAMQRLSAIGISLCAFFVMAIQASSNYHALIDAWSDPLGCGAMCAGVGLTGCGLLWMLYLSRPRI